VRPNSSVYNLILAGVLFGGMLMPGGPLLAAPQNPCSDDIAKYCKDVSPAFGAILRCLEEHESQLSDACKEYEAKMERPREESREAGRRQMRVRSACRDDVMRFCSHATSGGSAVVSCLKDHVTELSGPCGDAVMALQKAEGEEGKK